MGELSFNNQLDVFWSLNCEGKELSVLQMLIACSVKPKDACLRLRTGAH